VTQSKEAFDFTEQARTATAVMASAFLAPGAEALLKAQAGFIAAAEMAAVDWLHRRREAISDAQHLVARLRESRDVAGVLQAQQDWMAGTFRRFTADAEACSKAAVLLAAGAKRDGEDAGQDARAAAQAAEHASSRARFRRAGTGH